MTSANGVHKTRHRSDDFDAAHEATPIDTRKYMSLGMDYKKQRLRDGIIITIVRIPNAYRRCNGWENKKYVYSALPEDN